MRMIFPFFEIFTKTTIVSPFFLWEEENPPLQSTSEEGNPTSVLTYVWLFYKYLNFF